MISLKKDLTARFSEMTIAQVMMMCETAGYEITIENGKITKVEGGSKHE